MAGMANADSVGIDVPLEPVWLTFGYAHGDGSRVAGTRDRDVEERLNSALIFPATALTLAVDTITTALRDGWFSRRDFISYSFALFCSSTRLTPDTLSSG